MSKTRSSFVLLFLCLRNQEFFCRSVLLTMQRYGEKPSHSKLFACFRPESLWQKLRFRTKCRNEWKNCRLHAVLHHFFVTIQGFIVSRSSKPRSPVSLPCTPLRGGELITPHTNSCRTPLRIVSELHVLRVGWSERWGIRWLVTCSTQSPPQK